MMIWIRPLFEKKREISTWCAEEGGTWQRWWRASRRLVVGRAETDEMKRFEPTGRRREWRFGKAQPYREDMVPQVMATSTKTKSRGKTMRMCVYLSFFKNACVFKMQGRKKKRGECWGRVTIHQVVFWSMIFPTPGWATPPAVPSSSSVCLSYKRIQTLFLYCRLSSCLIILIKWVSFHIILEIDYSFVLIGLSSPPRFWIEKRKKRSSIHLGYKGGRDGDLCWRHSFAKLSHLHFLTIHDNVATATDWS